MRVSRFLRNVALTGALSLVPALANAATMAPPPADIWTRYWSVCTLTGMKSCHSIQFRTQIVGGMTAVTVTIRNLSGQAAGSGDNTVWSGLNQLRFYGSGIAVSGLDATPVASGTVGTQGGATTGGATNWNHNLNGTGTPGILRLNGLTAPDGSNRRIGGCTPGTGGTAPVMFTCGGEIVFSFNTNTLFNAGQMDQIYIRADGQVGSTFVTNSQCQTDGAVYTGSTTTGCVDAKTHVTVTPEPVSMALLGTGLFGMAGARMRRKKKTEV